MSRYRMCRLCGERTYDYDAETGQWFCGECEDWADV